MDIAGYLSTVQEKFASGHATEHSYRAALEGLFRSIDDTIKVINEPKRSEGGMPDFLFLRDGVIFGWAEAKDVRKDILKLKGYSVEQRKRYENAYPNLIYTNGVDFEFIRDKQVVHHTSIADFMGDLGGLQPLPDRFGELERQLKSFAEQKPISIRSAQKLAEMMAGKAAIIKDEIGIALADDPDYNSDLAGQYVSFKDTLLPNLTPGEFADIYAETITYGMFAARLTPDGEREKFSRAQALERLPATNPFLKGLFKTIAGDLPKRLSYVVDDLVAVLRASDPHSLFAEFGKFTARNDPFIHFYETFLAAYNPKKRKSRGVWYTPEPVVDFIVRAVDDVLKSEFGIADGLASTDRIEKGEHAGQHKVQILDPATGTGTFLAKAVQLISDRVKARAPGKWSSYVEEDLLPRLHGFELLMASYAMCHMKLDMQLAVSGYKRSANPPEGAERLSVWLTNALEPADEDIGPLFFQALRREAQGASKVKNKTPIMCVIGNPPYSGHSSNKGKWIERLVADYKTSPELKRPAQAKWLSDDYVKFIRMAEETISQNPSGGVLGFISNHGYVDNPTFLDMRRHLLRTFDKIWVLDLHGNAKKKEVSPDGSPDKNVFDIQQGVALIIAVRKGKGSEKLSEAWHGDLWGSRKAKNDALWDNSLATLPFTEVNAHNKPWRFEPVDEETESAYIQGFSVAALFAPNGRPAPGIVTTHDQFAISWSIKDAVEKTNHLLATNTEEDARKRFRLCRTSQWSYDAAKRELPLEDWKEQIEPIAYRPFDERFTVYNSHVAVHRRERISRHLLHTNLAFQTSRQQKSPGEYAQIFAHSGLAESGFVSNKSAEIGSSFPLYLYPDEDAGQFDTEAPTERTLNLDPKLYAEICEAAGIDPADTAGPEDDFRAPTGEARPSEVKVFDYIYGVLHSPDYRETFAEFLKIDFPRVPFPASPEVFKHVSEKGESLRRLHLMEPAAIGDAPYRFMGDVEEGEEDSVAAAAHPKYKDGRVYINPHQYFDDVPEVAWNFYIGGYQPAQKWLKDRKRRALSYGDIGHYQNIVKILIETDRIMREIELPLDAGEAGSSGKRPLPARG